MHYSRRHLIAQAGVAAGLIAFEASISPADAAIPFRLKSRAATVAQFGSQRPSYWGMYAPGVRSRFSTATSLGRDAIALTFDACGGSVTRYDDRLIAALRTYQVPATLFINRTWATNNPGTFKSLLADPLFEIQNHGWLHQPLSVTGRSAYGIAGTRNLSGVWEEVASNNWYMGYYYNHQTTFMRVGTCFTDDVASRAAAWMGQPLVSFSINGDAGASYPAATVTTEVCKARPGDIVISHMNHPGGGTAPGYEKALPILKARGLKFRHLSQVL